MWKPNQEGLKELLRMFEDSLTNNNQKHLEVYQVNNKLKEENYRIFEK